MKKPFLSLLLCLTTATALGAQSQVGASSQKIVTAAQVNGTWKYKGNIFKIWALGKQKLKVEFVGVYEYKTPDGPMANTGYGSGTARIEGDTAIFKPDDSYIDEDCKVTMKFTGGKLIVDQEGLCGFGFHVGASGTYRRISTAKPKFGEIAQRIKTTLSGDSAGMPLLGACRQTRTRWFTLEDD
jgi:hypothetical protein